MRKFSWLVAALLIAGCGGGGNEQAASNDEPAKVATETPAPDAAVAVVAVSPAKRSVSCGCAIESIGACGNYVEIQGEWVEVGNPDEIGIGPMEWCGQAGLHADTAGEVKDSKFFASTLAVHSH